MARGIRAVDSLALPLAAQVAGDPSVPAADGATAPAAAAAPSGGAAQLDKVEITGGRADDVQERRQSTAAKIIIGREEIERFGDSTLGDVLKRLPA
jgi:iron complex outermembrane receptor protein